MIGLALASIMAIMAPQDTIRMTLDEALTRAKASNPGFRRELLGWDNDHVAWLEARAERFLPEVGVELSTPSYVSALRRVANSDGSDRFVKSLSRTIEGEVEISQPLPTGGTFRISGVVTSLNQPLREIDERFEGATFLGFELEQDFFGINGLTRNYRRAREEYISNQTEFLEAERELATDVIEQYYDLVQAIKEAQIDSVLFVRDSIRSAENRPGAGQALSLLDSLKFAGEASRSAFSRTESRQELARTRAEFNEMFDLPISTVIVPDTVVRLQRMVVDPVEGLAYARANRLDLKLAELSVDNRRANLRDAHKTSPITVALNGRIGFDGNSENAALRQSLSDALYNQDRSTSISLSVSIPLFDRFDERYSVRQANNDLLSSEISFEEQMRELENEVHLAAEEVANAIAQLELAENQFQITRQTMEIQTGRFARNEIPSTEFLIDQADAREAEVDLLEAQVGVLLAQESWKRAIGVPPFLSAAQPGQSAPPVGRASERFGTRQPLLPVRR